MPDTTNRPTPREVIHDFMRYTDKAAMGEDADNLVAILAEHGYVIVHPDDVPVKPTTRDDYEFSNDLYADSESGQIKRHEGWNDCRAHIFGDDQ